MFTHGAWHHISANMAGAGERMYQPDDVLCAFSTFPNNRFMLVYAMSWAPNDNTSQPVTETNAIEIVRTGTQGVGGDDMNVEPLEVGSDPGSPNGIFADSILSTGWPTSPTVTDVIGGARPFSLERGWRWSAAQSGQPIVIQPGPTTGIGLGLRIKQATTREINAAIGITVLLTSQP